MRARLLYMLVFIFCLSAFASSKNECTCPYKGSVPCEKANAGSSKLLPSKEVPKEVTEEKSDVRPSDNEPQVRSEDFSTFQLVKFLYI